MPGDCESIKAVLRPRPLKVLNGVILLVKFFVGVTGFEPATTWSQTRCATGLRYAPNVDLSSLTRQIYG